MDYAADYFKDKKHFGTEEYTWESRQPFEQINAELLRAFCPGVQSVLDFGCGRGFFLKQLEDEGYPPGVGLEVSDWCIQNAIDMKGTIFPLNEQATPAEAVRDALQGLIFDAVVSIFSMEHVKPCHLPDLVDTLIYVARKWMMIRVPLADIQGPRKTWALHTESSGHHTVWPMKKWIALFESSKHFCKFRHAYISQDRDVLCATMTFFTGDRRQWNHFSDEPYPVKIRGRNEVETTCQ